MNLMLVENIDDEEGRRILIDGINQSAAEGSVQALRGLKESFRMIADAVVEHLTEEERTNLDQRLREKFGKGLREESEGDARLIAAVRRRGTIRHEREYRTIDQCVNELAQGGGDATLIKELESLLEQFARGVHAKRAKVNTV